MSEPRKESAMHHAVDSNGKVTGVHLTVHELDDKPYEVLSVRVLGEREAEGRTIAAVSIAGPHSEGVRPGLLMGYGGSAYNFDGCSVQAGWNAVITNKFSPPNLGPLAIALVDPTGQILSDVVGSLGLPDGRHVSYEIQFGPRLDVAEAHDTILGEVSAIDLESAAQKLGHEMNQLMLPLHSYRGGLADA